MTRPRLRPGVRLRWDQVRGSWMLLAPERAVRLSESAAEIVAACDHTRSVEEIIVLLARRHTAPMEAVGRDVYRLLVALAERGMVRA